MITQNGFNAKIYKAKRLESQNGIIFWSCTITLATKLNGYWGYRRKGEFVPYLEYWQATLFTDMPVEVGDEIKVSEFALSKWRKKKNEFDKGEWLINLAIYGFTNTTWGYAVQAIKRRRKSDKISAIVKTTNKEAVDELQKDFCN